MEEYVMASGYPERVTPGEDGIYRWSCRFDREQRKKTVKTILWAVGVPCLIILLMMGWLCFVKGGNDVEMFLTAAVSCAAAMAITAVICLITYRTGASFTQPYEMGPEYVRYVGKGRTDFVYYYRESRHVRICEARNLIEIRGLISTAPFHVPVEDFGFVKNYIISQVTCSVEYTET